MVVNVSDMLLSTEMTFPVPFIEPKLTSKLQDKSNILNNVVTIILVSVVIIVRFLIDCDVKLYQTIVMIE